MQSLRIIQRCDHTKRIESEVTETVQLYRQEVRESVVLLPTSEKLSYHGEWRENKNSKGEVIQKVDVQYFFTVMMQQSMHQLKILKVLFIFI